MGLFGKRRSVIAKKRKLIEKELSSVSSDIRSLSRSVGTKPDARRQKHKARPDTDPGPGRIGRDEDGLLGQSLAPPGYGELPDPQKKPRSRQAQLHDERFVGYLANSFDSMRPLRHERRIQRNKAIVMAIFVLLLLFWLICRHFFM